MSVDRAEIKSKYSELQNEIDFYLEQKERAEVEYIRARATLNKIDDKLENLSKQMIKLIALTYKNKK